MTRCLTLRIRRMGLLLLAASVSVVGRCEETGHTKAPDAGPAWGYYQVEPRDPALPNVLLMGDSILIGYRGTVTAALRGKANVDVFLNPFHQASPDLYPQLGAIFAKGVTYAVIHFNLGLHGWQKGRIPEGQFEPLTIKLVSYLQTHAPRAQLIWASTTPATQKGRPGFLDPIINPVIVEQNRAAATVMGQCGIPIDDLYGLMIGRLNLARGDQVHWLPAGSDLQGAAVANVVLAHLPTAPTPGGVRPRGT